MMRAIERRRFAAVAILGTGLLLLTGCPPPPPDPGGGTTTTTTTTTSTTTTTVPPSPSIDPTEGPPGTTISVTVPCVPEANNIPVATARAALLDDVGGLVVDASVDNSSSGDPAAIVVLVVPLDAAPGAYTVTSSCDTYTGTLQYDPVAFTVT